MIWAAFSFNDRSDNATLHGKQNADTFCTVLDQYFHPLMNIHILNNYGIQLQQVEASIHTAGLTRDWWFKFSFVRVLDWPACLLDLNPKEM